MKRTVQIYVADADNVLQRLDLFKDETISLTDTIQDVRDIAKVFTEFSQSFTVPASKTNNKVFRHFYNADISDGYDSRLLHNARIEINNIPFKRGFITLEGVDMKDNKPNSYRITFYGETVTLKDIIGDDKLSNLNFPSSLNKTYSDSDILTSLKLDPSSNDVITPLITHTQRLFYSSTTHVRSTGNLFFHTGDGSHLHGVRWDNLKYALRVHQIILAIQSTYGITFSDDFFNTTNETYYNLFMWLHRKKGYVENLSGFNETKISTFGSDTTTAGCDALGTFGDAFTEGGVSYPYLINASSDSMDVREPIRDEMNKFQLDLSTSSSVPYTLRVTRNGVDIFNTSELVGDTRITDSSLEDAAGATGTDNFFTWVYQPGIYEVYVTPESTINITFSMIEWDIRFERPTPDISKEFCTGSIVTGGSFDFIISQQIPDMGVIDFLTGLFKMFNLTAFVESDGTIYVDTLDEFYVDKQSSGNPYTIDEFVDSTKNTVDSALPFREVKFRYEDTGTLLAKQHEQIAGTVWAEEEFNRNKFASIGLAEVNTNISGEIYTVEAPFGHLKFEKIIDTSDSSQTTIQWGYSADDNFNEDSGDYDSYIGKPVLFYPILNQAKDPEGGSNVSISFVDDIDTEGVFQDHEEITVPINMPSNSVYFDPTSPNNSKNINFKAEKNEYQGSEFDQTLFKVYYETYIKQMFTKSNRIIKLKAYLPLRILLNYTLADKFIYKGRKHQINSITTNLTTGESEIELLNIVIE